MESAGDLLKRFLDSHNLGGGESYVSFFSSWEKLVGTDLAAHSAAVDIKHHAVIVEFDHPGWMQVFQMNLESILKRVQRAHPDLEITNIHMRLGGETSRIGSLRTGSSTSGTQRRDVEQRAAQSDDTPAPSKIDLREAGETASPRLRESLRRLREQIEKRDEAKRTE